MELAAGAGTAATAAAATADSVGGGLAIKKVVFCPAAMSRIWIPSRQSMRVGLGADLTYRRGFQLVRVKTGGKRRTDPAPKASSP